MQPTKRAQLAIFFTVFVDLLGFGIVIPILPLYAKGLAAHPAPWMAWVNQTLGLGDPGVFWAGATMVLFSLAQFFAGPILGRISDLVGRRPVLLVSLLGTCASYLVLGTAGSIGWVLASRLFGGFTGGSISVAQAAMADSSSPKERSKVLGMIGAAFGLGFVFGPAMAGILSGLDVSHRLQASHGWYLPFLVAAGLSFTAAMLVLVWLPETLNPSAKTHARVNRSHAVVRALKRPGMPQIMGIALLAMTGFAMMEGTFSLLANTRFGLGEREVGFMLFLPLGILISVYQGGLVRLVVKFLPERIAQFAGLLMLAAALPFIAFAPWKWPFVLLMIPIAWGQGMNNTATAALASQLTPPDEQGALFGVLQAMQGLGRIAGPLVGSLTFARRGYAAPYMWASACICLALLLALSVIRTPRVVQDEAV